MAQTSHDIADTPSRNASIITLLSVIVASAVILPAGSLTTENIRANAERHQRAELLGDAMVVAATLPRKALSDFLSGSGGMRLAAGRRIEGFLERADVVRPVVNHVLLLNKSQGKIVSLLSTAPPGTPLHISDGDAFEAASDRLVEIHDRARPALVGPYSYAGHRWLAAVGTVRIADDLLLVALVADEDDIRAGLDRIRLTGFVLTLLTCIAGVGFIVTMDRYSRLAEVARLQREEIAAGQEIERKLRESEDRYRNLFDNTFEGVLVHDGHVVLEVNQSMAKMFHCPPDDLIGRTVDDLVAPSHREQARARLDGGDLGPHETEAVRPDGSTFPLEVAMREVLYEGQPVLVVTARDITARRKLERSLAKMAFLDELSGLYNRRGFMTVGDQQLRAAKRRKSNAALFYADVDNLKAINDRHGHPAGDQAIAAASEVLKRCFRQSDVLARVGGDEFAILAVDCGPEAIPKILKAAYENVDRYNAESDAPFDIAFSMGAAPFDPLGDSTVRDLLRRADEMMYEEKRRRKLSRAHDGNA